MILSENDVMVDLETLGVVPGCAILSIGACSVLSPQNHFYMVCEDPLECGLTNNRSDTLRWWLGQNESARQALSTPTETTKECLDIFLEWLDQFPEDVEEKPFRIWSYGADFDLAILRFALNHFNPEWLDVAWGYRQSRCLRTFFDVSGRPDLPKPDNGHNALIDALYQSHLLRLACNQQEIPHQCDTMPSVSSASSV